MTDASPVICLMGPTASGKTELAAALYQRLPVDVVSVDSAMVYRGLDIGTAKPDRALLQQVPHALVDVVEPSERYSAGRFVVDATAAIEKSHAAGRIPLLVGGTMLYFSALTRGLSVLPSADAAVRSHLNAEARRDGWPALHARLARSDPTAAQRIHPNDAQRIQRALEIMQLSGRVPSEWHRQARPCHPRWRFIRCALWPADRGRLHAAIAERFQAMLAAGLLQEVAELCARVDITPDLPAMRTVGYRQIAAYCHGELSLPVAVERGITATRQLAKRQLTWLRRDQAPARFFVPDQAVLSKILNILAKAGLC